MSRIVIVVATENSGGIGYQGKLPWNLPRDLEHFKLVTMGKTILMGRKTHEDIGRRLPGRRNVVLTRQAGWSAEGVEVVHSLDEAIEKYLPEGDLYVIGGAELYALALPKAQEIIITYVFGDFECDAFFAHPLIMDWKSTRREDHWDAASGLNYSSDWLVRH